MPHFMVSCNYSAESKNAMIANPVDRTKAASAAIEAVGGKLHSAFMTFGETDIIVIYEAPDAIASRNCVRGTCYDAWRLRCVLVD